MVVIASMCCSCRLGGPGPSYLSTSECAARQRRDSRPYALRKQVPVPPQYNYDHHAINMLLNLVVPIKLKRRTNCELCSRIKNGEKTLT